MASPNIGFMLSTTINNYSGDLEDGVSNAIVLFRYLEKAGAIKKEDGGVKIYEEIEYTESSYSWIDDYDVIDATPAEPFDVSEYEWKTVVVPIVVSGTKVRQNAGSKTRIINLLEALIKNAEHTLYNQVGAACYNSATSAKQFVGLQAAVPLDPTTGTYGSINRADHEFWRTKLWRARTDGSVAALSSANIVQQMNRLHMLTNPMAGVRTDLGLFGDTVFSYYEDHCQALQRIMKPSDASIGFDAYRYKDMDIVRDPSMPSALTSTGFFLTCGKIGLTAHKDLYFSDLGDTRESWNQDATARYMGLMANVTMRQARVHGRLTDT